MEMETRSVGQLFPAGARKFEAFSQHGWSLAEPDWANGLHNLARNHDGVANNANGWLENGRGRNPFPPVSPINGLAHSLPNTLQQRLKLSEPTVVSDPDAETETDELFGSMQELESHALGRLLPDAEEDLLAEVGYAYERNSNEDDYDIFNSGGGLELEGDPYLNNYQIGGNTAAVLAGEHPYGEHPSRTLFVRNINSNVEDVELRALFEQYGAIRTLYTACKHRGFVMISYYDIRAARTAMRALQNKPLRRRKLDIHFSIPKDNPSDKDVNQGTLVVFNLDASVTNDDLRHIFGVYGEIKEIRETPHKKHHKFIEFYDVRAAEAALRALNRSDIAGKRIKLEPSRPGGARRSLMQQLTQELEQEEFRCQQLQASLGASPAGHSPQWSTPMNKLNERGTFGSLGIKPLNVNAGSLPARVSSPLRNGMSANPDSFIQPERSVGLRIRQQFPSLQIPDLDSPTRVPPGFGNYDELDAGTLQRAVSSLCDVPSLEQSSRAFGVSASRSGDLPWNSSGSLYSANSMYHADGHSRAADYSATFTEQSLMDGQNRYYSDLAERSALGWPGSLGGLRMNGSKGAGLTHGGLNLAAIATSKGLVDSPRLGVMSPQLRPRSFPNGATLETFSDRCRSRRTDSTLTLAENKKYQLDLERILRGEDLRTTLMIKNIPNKYTSKMLLSTIDEHHRGTYDFIYLPIDFKNKCNVGYAFINMIAPVHIVPFFKTFNGKKWEKFNSEKVASLAYARIQGKVALVAHFQNSSLMNEDKRCRPILFRSEGPNLGDPEPFPVGSNVRTRPGKERNGLCHFETSSSSSCSSKDDENDNGGQSSSDVEKD
ncbi:protein MEI2-like 5 [Selaginella moellendorffii]|nr:protein MEI2-like 5 [Selaginella moellendorffii]|eukprot:XP_024531271.1 protein MEI2-like 5 [Selaginella moellendorffii]